MKQFALLVFLICLSACLFEERKQEVFMTDSDYAEFERKFSPDSSMLLINYGIDLGATGYGQAGTAILKTQDTSKNLRLFTLPRNFHSPQSVHLKILRKSLPASAGDFALSSTKQYRLLKSHHQHYYKVKSISCNSFKVIAE